MTDPIPAGVRRLLRRHFTSASQVEVIIPLVEDRRPWTAEEVSDHLKLTRDHAAQLLDSLVREGLLAVEGDAYEFPAPHTKSPETVVELVRLYPPYRLRIVNLVFSQPSQQVRDFADAFRLRGDNDEDEET